MTLNRLKAKINGKKYLPFEQDGKTYNLYDLPKGFVIKGSLDLINKNLTELPDLSDVVVKGNFACSDNKLTSLKGAPQKVGGSFLCDHNGLTSLEGGPKEVGEYFLCNHNQLTSLKGAPKAVGEDFRCYNNGLTSLEGGPQQVGGKFDCHSNQLTSLKGAPQKVDGPFHCYDNKLTTLEGAPNEIGGLFRCNCNKLTSLEYAPLLKKNNKIYCDDSLGDIYGFPQTNLFGISREELCNNPLYRSEVAMNRVRSKIPQGQVKTQKKAFEKTNAEFSQWLKDNSNKPTRE